MYRTIRMVSVIVVLLLIFFGVGTLSTSAEGGAAQRGYLIGIAPVVGPDIARAANGDTIELVGSGTFTPQTERATGFGTFVHKNAAGATLAQGSWTATKLLRFRSYGVSTTPGDPPEFEGGRAFIRIHLAPFGGTSGFDAVLFIDCLVGSPPAGAEEGIQVRVISGPKFNEQVSGENLFIKLQQSEAEPEAPEAPADVSD